ncbi:MAG: Phytochrome-like protein cph1 [Bacteroidetes bacterium]|jgi:PAS domain S-box-containing protein|nr:Phytochrome-like protein cph1 [Bacteroidota bacterium]MDF2452519.1 Phytochrome-like protein cph1 [Bacteroidota bacterium]
MALIEKKNRINSPVKKTASLQNDWHIRQLAAIVQSSGDAIFTESIDGIIMSWNNSSEKLFGYSAEEAIGQHVSLIIPPECINESQRILERISQNESVESYEPLRRKKGGERLFVSITVSGLVDEERNIIGFSEIVRDITARRNSETVNSKELVFQKGEKKKRADELVIANKELAFQNEQKEKRSGELIIANKELAFQNSEKEKRAAEFIITNEEFASSNKEKEKRASELVLANKELETQNKEEFERATQLELVNKELESFSYSVSHDLRAPLRAIHGYARMLKELKEGQQDFEANRLMDNIIINSKKMGQLIDDLLTFSRLGRKELVRINISMNDMVTAICEELKFSQPAREIKFHIRPMVSVKADNVAMKQVWLNLISNSIKYSMFKKKTFIEIGSEEKENEIIYYVKDNGAGFDMRFVNKLFGIFQRLHTDEEFEGTGVGLAIVQRIIFKHGGRVWATGEVGEGATFYFALNKS